MKSMPTEKVNNVCLVILTIIAITVALIYTKTILVPFVISLFAYAVFSPVIFWFESKLKFSRTVSILLTLLLFLAVSALIFFFISISIENFIESANQYQTRVKDFINWGAEVLQGFGVDLNRDSVKNFLDGLPVFTFATNVTSFIFNVIGDTFLVIIFVLFFILGSGSGKVEHPLLKESYSKISHYLSAKFLISLITASAVGLILILLGVELAFMFAALTFWLNFIPNIGSLVATVLPLPVVVLQFGFGPQFFIVFVLSVLIQFAIGNIIEPKILGESMDLHPITVLIFLMFWGLVWGIPGMFLAVPITAIVKIILSRIEATQPLANLLAGKIQAN